ncbi:hypothetical protein FACS189426_19770 [Bacteroidia bacterium]|nr:hypothetical protein FACS189426_19770 [Bacteroidia bacterium]GHV71439.1 hypothetical protein FACS189420_6590 [Bacteroidia bacterium]
MPNKILFPTETIVSFSELMEILMLAFPARKNWWNLLRKNDKSESVAMVTVNPAFTAEYKIAITAYSFNSGYDVGYYGLIIFHE